MSYVIGFAPWIIWAVLSGTNWRVGLCAAALAALALVVHARRRHDLDLLTAVTFLFFAVMAVIALADPQSGLHNWTAALSAGTLAVIAWVSLALRRPFTLSIAKKQVPEDAWGHPLFLRTNDVLTAVWAGAFTLSCLACALIVHANAKDSAALIVAQVLGFAVPMGFTVLYSNRATAKGEELRRHAEAGGQAQTETP
jgi:nitrate reductase gamma subunit